ncbi:hypothetical protein EDB89DRAFT_1910896 [Lactarius sanguifluus]|nr:hypothetical protein EDB89DRAFT_1910896 [Lactarius sanguifluus]
MRRLDTQSDIRGVARVQSPRMGEKACPSISTITTTTTANLTLIRSDRDLGHNSVESDQTAARHAGGQEHPEHPDPNARPSEPSTRDPVCRAECYCETLGPLTDEEKHNAISQYLMEGWWTYEDEEDVSVEPMPQMLTDPEMSAGCHEQTEVWGSPRETTDANYGRRNKGQPTPNNSGENDPIAVIGALTDKQ